MKVHSPHSESKQDAIESLDSALKYLYTERVARPADLNRRILQKVVETQKKAHFTQLSALVVLSSILLTVQILAAILVFLLSPFAGMLALWLIVTELLSAGFFLYYAYYKILPAEAQQKIKSVMSFFQHTLFAYKNP